MENKSLMWSFTEPELRKLHRALDLMLDRIERDNNANYQEFSNSIEHGQVLALRSRILGILKSNQY